MVCIIVFLLYVIKCCVVTCKFVLVRILFLQWSLLIFFFKYLLLITSCACFFFVLLVQLRKVFIFRIIDDSLLSTMINTFLSQYIFFFYAPVNVICVYRSTLYYFVMFLSTFIFVYNFISRTHCRSLSTAHVFLFGFSYLQVHDVAWWCVQLSISLLLIYINWLLQYLDLSSYVDDFANL